MKKKGGIQNTLETDRKNLYTSGEAGRMLGISKYFLKLYQKQGLIEGKRIGGWDYYSLEAIRAAQPKIAALAQLKGENSPAYWGYWKLVNQADFKA